MNVVMESTSETQRGIPWMRGDIEEAYYLQGMDLYEKYGKHSTIVVSIIMNQLKSESNRVLFRPLSRAEELERTAHLAYKMLVYFDDFYEVQCQIANNNDEMQKSYTSGPFEVEEGLNGDLIAKFKGSVIPHICYDFIVELAIGLGYLESN